MKEKIKTYTLIGSFIAIAILLTLRQCQGPKVKETFLKGKEVVKYDTIKNTDTIVHFKTKYYPKWDSVKKTDTVWNASLCSFERTYNDSTIDSNITIYSKIETIGLLKSIKLDYKWKKPEIIKTISRTDTLVRPNKWDFYVNSELGGNKDQLNISVGAAIRYKKAYYGFRYDILDKTYNATIGYRLFKSKK